MAEKTAEQTRTDGRVEFSRLLRGAMHELDITQEQLAAHVGTTPQKVQRWCDHRNPEVPGLPDIRLFPRDLAERCFRWLVDGHHLAIVDELAPAESVRDHLAEIHRLAASDADVTTSFLGFIADGDLDDAEKRVLAKKLRHSIAVETAALRRLEGREVHS